MIIYNENWLSNLRLLNLVKEDYEQGLVPEDEWKAVRRKCVHGFYSPNIFYTGWLVSVNHYYLPIFVGTFEFNDVREGHHG